MGFAAGRLDPLFERGSKRKLAEATEQVASWKRREGQLASELAAAEANVGAEALESGDLEGAAAKVASLRDQFEAARRTVAAAEATQDVAQRDAWLAEAASRRAEAERLDKEADKHATRTRELLDALKEHEGGAYVPEQPQVGVASDVNYWTPRSEQLRHQATSARKAAHDLERKAERLGREAERDLTPATS